MTLLSWSLRILTDLLKEFHLEQFYNWLDVSKLELAHEKTTAVLFSSLQSKPTISVRSRRIPIIDQTKFLGVIIDKKLSWHQHIKYVKQKAIVATRAMTRMTGKHWGLQAPLMKIWYLTTIEKMLTYAASLWALNCNSNIKRHLQSAQRYFLLLISGAYRNTSNDALNVITGIPPIALKAQALAKIISFVQLGNNIDAVVRSDYEWKQPHPTVHPAFESVARMIEQKEDPSAEYTIFTDGSKMTDGTGCSVVIYNGLSAPTVLSFKLHPDNSVFQAELLALKEAVKWSASNSRSSVTIHTDSESAVKALLHPYHSSYLVQQTKNELRNAMCKINIKWVKAHVGILGNERADSEAKLAISNNNAIYQHVPLPTSLFRTNILKGMMNEWQTHWEYSLKGRDLFQFMPKVSLDRNINCAKLVAFFTGHGPFVQVLHRLGLSDTPMCVCGELGTPVHYATVCSLTREWHISVPASNRHRDCLHEIEGLYKEHWKLKQIYDFLMEHKEEIKYTLPNPGVQH